MLDVETTFKLASKFFDCLRSKGKTEKNETVKALVVQLSEDLDKKLEEMKNMGFVEEDYKEVKALKNYLDEILEENYTWIGYIKYKLLKFRR